MTKLTWLIERNCFKDSEPRLIESIMKADQSFNLVEYIPVVKEAKFPSIHGDRKYVFHGSINLGRYFQRYSGPLTLHCNWDNYKCSKYYTYPYIHNLLLNSKSSFYPYGALRSYFRDRERGDYFIRPDSGGKPFSGTVIHSAFGLDGFYRNAELYDEVKPDTMCVIAPATEDIAAEYRCIVIGGKAITCSRYGKIAEEELDKARNPVIIERTQELLDNCKYRPDDAFTVDWAVMKQGWLRIVEFNSFSCAGMYDCNTDKIVDAMGKLILGEDDE